MAEITEKLIFDDSQAIPAMKTFVAEAGKVNKSIEGMYDAMDEANKVLGEESVEAANKNVEANKKVAKEQRETSKTFLESAKSLTIFGVSYDSLKKKSEEYTAILKSATSSLIGFGKLTKLQTDSINNLAGSSKAANIGLTAFARGFNVLKAAIVATGFGALVLALGALISYFTKTQSGVDKVSRVMQQLGAIVGVLTDRLSAVGEKIVKAFDDPKQAIIDLKDLIIENIINRFQALPKFFGAIGAGIKAALNFDGEGVKKSLEDLGLSVAQFVTGVDSGVLVDEFNKIKTEIDEAGDAAGKLADRKVALRKATIELTVAEAKARAGIALDKKTAEDVTKGYGERIEAAKRAIGAEQELLNQKIKIAQENANIVAAEKALSNSLAADEAQVAEAYAAVSNLKAESLEKQIELNNKINGLVTEMKTKFDEAKKALFEFAEGYGLIGSEEARQMALAEQIKLLESQRDIVKDIAAVRGDESEETAKILKLYEAGIERLRIEAKKVTPIDIIPSANLVATQTRELQARLDELKELQIKMGIDTSDAQKEVSEQIAKIAKNPLGNGVDRPKITLEVDLTPRVDREKDPFADQVGDFLDGIETFEDLYNVVMDRIFKSRAEDVKEFISGLGSFVSEWGALLDESTDLQITQIDKQVEELAKRREKLQEGLSRELELQEKGLANNVGAKEAEVNALLAEEERLNLERDKLQREAQRRQILADSVAQGQSLITSSINIIKGFSNIPVVGLPLGIAAVAALLAFFVKTKSQALKATRLFTGANSIKDHFGFGDYHGDTDLPGKGAGYRLVQERTGRPTNVVISGKEMLLPEDVSIPNKTFFSNLRAGMYSGLDLDNAINFYKKYSNFVNQKETNNTVRETIVEKVVAPKQQNRQVVVVPTKDGKYRGVLVPIDPSAADFSTFEFNL